MEFWKTKNNISHLNLLYFFYIYFNLWNLRISFTFALQPLLNTNQTHKHSGYMHTFLIGQEGVELRIFCVFKSINPIIGNVWRSLGLGKVTNLWVNSSNGFSATLKRQEGGGHSDRTPPTPAQIRVNAFSYIVCM